MHNRIAVGYDGSPAAQYALDWAVREAIGWGSTVLVVTAWPGDARGRRDVETLTAQRLRLHRIQRRGVAAAVAGLSRPPVVAREIILADPVTALAYAAKFADIVVVGGEAAGALRPGSVGAALARRLSRRGRGGPPPVIVLATTRAAAPDAPAEPTAASRTEPAAASPAEPVAA
jgi:hypothetical protein